MLIIYAHPNREGNCGYVLKQIEQYLQKRKTNYEVLDLYQTKFNPVLQPEEHYTSGHEVVAKEIETIQKKIKKEEKIILIYPTWWNGTPAILKGFFERVLTSGFAFRYLKGIPRGLLQGKKAIVITTTGGHIFLEKIFLGNRSLKVVVKDTLRFCGIKAKGYMIGSANKFTEKQKRMIEKKVATILKAN